LEQDEALYLRVLSGDRQALALLAERYYAPLLAFLTRVTGQVQTAEDLVQECFIRMLKYRGPAPSTFRPWAFRIAHNLARDGFRSAANRREIASNVDEAVEEVAPREAQAAEQLAIQADDRAQVAALLQRLPVNQREVLVLRFYHDLPLVEIAEITGVPLGTVKSRLFHSLRRSRQLLELDEVKQNEPKC
jgi:RNA polymerase sigma-70 factor (ECF subfamily)